MNDLRKLIADVLKLPQGSITDSLQMKGTMGWDSLKHMELILTIERTYGIELTGDDIADMISIIAIEKTLARYGVKTCA